MMLFLGVSFVYWSLAPANISGTEYEEEIVGAKQLLADRRVIFPGAQSNVLKLPPQDIVPVLGHLPFLLVAAPLNRLFQNQEILWSVEPVLLTSSIVLFVFLIIRRVTGDQRRAFLFSVAAGFTTMLWPYAYIGLEVQQSFFVMLTAYLVFRKKEEGSWGDLVLISISVAMALSVKWGCFLAPGLAYLLFQFTKRGERSADRKLVVRKILLAFGILLLFYTGHGFIRQLAWPGASRMYVPGFIVQDLVSYFMNAAALIGSPNKGIIAFAPIVLLGFLWRPDSGSPGRPIFVFAVLVTAGLVLGLSFSTTWADELWGPRYLHASVAPWVMSMAVSRQATLKSRQEVPAIALAVVLGLGVSFLGAFFSYSALHAAAVDTHEAQLETIQSNPAWNHVRFNARLMRIWINPRAGRFWVPPRQWYFDPPVRGYVLREVNLGIYADPQPALVRAWGTNWGQWTSLMVSLFTGLSLLLVAFRTASRHAKYTLELVESQEASAA